MIASPRARKVVLLALGIPGILLPAACAPEHDSAIFEYRDRSTAVMEVHFLPGRRMRTTQFSVFADGRVIGRVVGVGGDRRVLEEFEQRLDEAQVREWIELAVQSGLVDFDASKFVREISESGGQLPDSVDGGAVFFKIELDILERETDASGRAYSHSFILDQPDEYARRFPASAEVRTLHQITTVLEEIYWTRSKQR